MQRLTWTALLALLVLNPGAAIAEPDSAGQPQPGEVKPANGTEQWLDTVIIPHVEFKAATFFDCLDFVQAELDKAAANQNRAAPRFVYHITAIRQLLPEPYSPSSEARLCTHPLPTFAAKDIPAFRVILLLAALADVRFVASPDVIIVEGKKKATNQTSQPIAGKPGSG
jgi:hypothetical protein